MRTISLLPALAVLACSAAAAAADGGSAAPPASERRLSPEQVEEILAEAATRREAAARPMPDEPDAIDAPSIRQMHGEVGLAVGTGGYREMYGTAIYPLGDDGIAAISLNFVDWGRRRYRR